MIIIWASYFSNIIITKTIIRFLSLLICALSQLACIRSASLGFPRAKRNQRTRKEREEKNWEEGKNTKEERLW